jgi:hypothetical protein
LLLDFDDELLLDFDDELLLKLLELELLDELLELD